MSRVATRHLCNCIFEVNTLVCSKQHNCYENGDYCSKHMHALNQGSKKGLVATLKKVEKNNFEFLAKTQKQLKSRENDLKTF